MSNRCDGDLESIEEIGPRETSDTVTPPPSTNTRAQPRARRSRSTCSASPPGRSASMPAMTPSPMWLSPGATSERAQMYSVGTTGSVNTRNVGISRRLGSNTTRSGFGPGTWRVVSWGSFGCHGAGADDDRVAQGPHAVNVHDVVAAGDELGVARRRRDESVEALAEMADRHRPRGGRAAHRQVQIQQLRSLIARRQSGFPSGSRMPCKHRIGTVGRQRSQALVLVLFEHPGAAFSIERLGQGTRGPEDAPGGIRRRPALLDGCRHRLGRHMTRHYATERRECQGHRAA